MSTFPSVRTYIRISTATTLRISVKFCIGVCYKKGCRVYQLVVENGGGGGGGGGSRVVYVMNLVRFTVAGDIKSP
jgi:hypothetical protein